MITIAELFVSQTHLTLDDEDGPYTTGTVSEVIDWVAQKVVSASQTFNTGRKYERPQHYLMELEDNSAVVVVIDHSTKEAWVANKAEIKDDDDWDLESEVWVLVGGQRNAEEYVARIRDCIIQAPHPDSIIRSPQEHSFSVWADTVIIGAQGEMGTRASGAANVAKHGMQRRRADIQEPDQQ